MFGLPCVPRLPGQCLSSLSVFWKRLQGPGRYLLLPDSLVCSRFSQYISIGTLEPEGDNIG